MKLWKQILLCAVILVAGLAAWVRFAPGAGAMLASLGVPGSVVTAITPEQPKTAAATNAPRNARLVATQPVATALINDRLSAIGTGEAIRTVTVTPYVTGNLAEVLVKSGDTVQQGQVIAQLDNDEQRIAVDQAHLTRKSAQEKVERYRNLKTVISSVEFTDTANALEAAELQVQAAELALKRREITAPWSGVVGIITVNPGDYVTTSSAIATIDDRSEILVDFWVPERFAPRLKVGQNISATAIARPERQLAGRIDALDNRIDQASRTLRVRARIANENDSLRAGMSFSVAVEFAGDTYPTVDPLAIQWSSQGAYVWRVADDKSAKVPVRIVQRNSDRVLVEGDLREGEMVATEGVQQLRDGSAVRVAQTDAPATPASGS
ncbi:efflux RND transporter periplasmic adaptor subunit [Rhizobium sp. CFBP 8762]|uniref:efflux RND transporter periplasmic adaptor subunit n=1 Tax=Rhizobium sp. CFBP 8762 TaxID=2775279 RepID=UPI00177DB5B3|nr:efflux RND transporter periplasmic adaptor subunit [Rhizobium sp. CFBP 8762]MBD8554795.1 efflux RND transporter periplasmic adaptor subunit [Rhizobium sp. CFBP 8762]